MERALRTSASWLLVRDATNMWAEQRLALLGAVSVLGLALRLVTRPGAVGSSVAGVAVVSALDLSQTLKFVVYYSVQVARGPSRVGGARLASSLTFHATCCAGCRRAGRPKLRK